MARIKKVPRIPHNVKERFRHQNLQRLLETVASHVPQLPAMKKETKAKKLRRILLYMAFLQRKRKQLSQTGTEVQEHSCISSVEESKEVLKEKENSKVHSAEKSKSRHPQIVFLRKSSQASSRNRTSATVTHEEAPCAKRCDSECNDFQMSSDAHMSLSNQAKLYDSQQGNSSPNYCSPFNVKDLDCDIYPPSNFKTPIATFENPSLSVFKRPWEETMYDQTEMCNIRPAKKVALKTRLSRKSSNQTKDTFDLNRSSIPECAFAESSKNDSFNVRNSGLNKQEMICEIEPRKFSDKRNSKREELPPFTAISHPMFRNDAKAKPLATLNHLDTFHPNLYFGNASLISNSPREVSFLQDEDNCPLEFFSSSESAPITSSGEWFSSDETDFVEKMSQESTDYDNAPVMTGNENSSSVVNKLSCGNYQDPTETFCDMEQYVNYNQTKSFYASSTMNPDLNMSELSSHYFKHAANLISAEPDELQNVWHPKLVRRSDNLNFQQHNLGYYVYPVSRIYDNGENSESILEQDNSGSPQESYYIYPRSCDNGTNSESILEQHNSSSPQESYYVYTGRCDNGTNSESNIKQDTQESYYPEDEVVPRQNYQARLVEIQRNDKFKRTQKEHTLFVPNNDCLLADLNEDGDFFGNARPQVANESVGCSSRKQPEQESSQFGHSTFKVGDECNSYDKTVVVKEEEPDSYLLAEEISYSLNNLDAWYGNCFNVQQAQ